MGRVLVALYKDAQTARQVVDALLEAGFSADDISLLLNETGELVIDAGHVGVAECAGLGALVGALVGVGSALVPGIGPALGVGAVGVIMTAGIGAAVGALTGGITAGLIDIEPRADETQLYANHLVGEGMIVCLTTHEQWLEWAEKIMLRHQPLKIEGRAADGYSSPWITLEREQSDSRKMAAHSRGSSTKMRQIDSSISLRKRAHIYEYRN